MIRPISRTVQAGWLLYFFPYALLYFFKGRLNPLLAFFLSVPCMFFLPGFAASSMLLRGRDRDTWERIGLSCLMSLFLFCALCLVCTALNCGLRFVEWGYTVTAVLLGAAALATSKRRAAGQRFPIPDKKSIAGVALLLLSISVLLGLSQGSIDTYWDSLDHLSYVRQILLDDSIQPTSVLYHGDDGIGVDPRKGFFHPLIAVVCRAAGVDPVTAWFWLPTMLGPLVGLMFFLFARRITGSTPISALATALFFLLYPEGNPLWFNGVAFPGRFCLGIMWLGFAMYLRYEERSRRTDLALAAVAGFVLLGFHLPSFFLFLGGCIALALACIWKRHTNHVKPAALLLSLVVLFVAAIPVLYWRWVTNGPAVNPVHTHLHGVLYIFDGLYIAGVAELSRWLGWLGWVAIVASLFLPRLTGERRASYLLVVLTVCSLLVAINPFLIPLIAPKAGYLAFRTLRIIPFALILVLLLASLLRLARARNPIARRVVASILLLAVTALMSVRLHRFVLAQSNAVAHRGRIPYEWRDGLQFLSNMGGVQGVATDPLTSYTIVGLTNHKVVAVLGQHGPPNDPSGLDRLVDQRRILSPYTPVDKTVALMNRYHVKLVYLNHTFSEPRHMFQYSIVPDLFGTQKAKFDEFPDVFEPLWSGDNQWVYKLRENVKTNYPSTAVLAPSTIDTVFTNEAVSVFDSICLMGHRFDHRTAARDSTLSFDVFWEKRALSSSQLPLVLIVRFDHELPRGPMWNRRYGRMYRKVLESRTHGRYRFRRNLLPGHGVYRTQDWASGDVLKDRYEIWIPDNIHTGRYTVRMKLVQFPLLLNLRLADIFQDDDMFGGTVVDTLEIR